MTSYHMPTRLLFMTLGLAFPAVLSAGQPAHRFAPAREAMLQVVNNNPQAVYLVVLDEQPDGWAQWPLGVVEKGARGTFYLRGDILARPNVRIVASAFSNWQEYSSRPLTFRAGRQLDLTLNNPEPSSLLAAS